MSKSKSDLSKGLRVLYAIPLICLSLALNAEEKVNYVISDDEDTTKVADGKTSDTIKIKGGKIDTVFVTSYAPKTDEKGIVVIIDGKLAQSGDLAKIDPKQIADFAFIKVEEEVAVYRQKYNLDDDVKDVTVITLKKTGNETDTSEEEASAAYPTLEVKPQFNGGDANEFAKWVNMNLVYPESAKKAWHTGTVTVSFTINREGEVVDAKILRGTGHADLDNEALRVIQSSPKWTPAMQDGKPVPVTFTFPVIFQQR